MTTGRWVVFDTNVYVLAIRGGLFSPIFQMLQEQLPRTYLVSVVSAELRAGTRTESARRDVHQLTLRFHRVHRVVTPTTSTWERAGDLLGMVRRREPHLRSKIRALWNDLLIALSARQIGATVVTYDAEDFERLRRYVHFNVHVLSR